MSKFEEVTPCNFNPMWAPKLSDEARKAVNAAFDAMSTWRIYENEEDDGANANAACAAHGKTTRSILAPIFYLVAARQFIQAHVTSPRSSAVASLIPIRRFEAAILALRVIFDCVPNAI